MNTLNLVAAGDGLSLSVGAGMIYYYGNLTWGSMLLILGVANLVRFMQLGRRT